MLPVEATSKPNQIAFDFMVESDVMSHRTPGTAAAGLPVGDPAPAYLPILAGIFALGVLVLAVAASGGSQPVLLTLLSAFAILGVFFLFGLTAGHVRIGDRLAREDFARAVAEQFDRGLLVAGRGGTAVYANPMMEELVGRSGSNELLALEAAVSADLPGREAYFRLMRAAERGERHTEEVRLSSSGPGIARVLTIEVRPFALGHRRESGPLTLWSVVDVTALKQREAKIRQAAEAKIEDYEAAPVGIAAVDEAGSIRHMNATLARWLGHQVEPGSGRAVRLADILAPESLELVERAMRKGDADTITLDVDATRDDGRLLPVKLVARSRPGGVRLVAFFNRDGGALGSTSMDQTLVPYFQNAPFGIASVSSEGRITTANAAFRRLMQETTGFQDRRAIDVLVRDDDRTARVTVEECLKRVLAGKASAQPVEIRVGEERAVRRVYMSPLVERSSPEAAAMLYVIDATEQKALEEQFAQSSKMEAVGILAGGIAHDFNNVLTAIIGNSDLLLQTHRPYDPAYKDIKSIQSSAYRAAGMVRQLLSFSRRQTLKAEPLLLDEVLNESASMLRTTVGEKVKFRIQPSRDLWYVNVDRNEFERVIVNLVVNAKDAMPNGGDMTLSTRNITERESQRLGNEGMPVGEYVAFEIEDTGIGMPREVIDKIFEPFFTTKDVGKGTGLGLATVYGIVKQSGGFVYVDSTPAKGTTFRVYLPRYIPDEEEEAQPNKEREKAAAARAQDLTGTGRVLLVEDEDAVRSFAVRALKRQGYEVLEAASGVEALEVMSENEGRVDIVVTDVVMPEMDGPTLFKELRRRNPGIKVIFVSGYPNEAFRETLGSEDVAFLPKPFSLPQLAAKVKDELSK